MGQPILIGDGSPVKIAWLGPGWTPDNRGQVLTKDGGRQLDVVLFNLVKKIKPRGRFRMSVGYRKGRTDVTLLVSTDDDRRNLRLEIENIPADAKFTDFFKPRRNVKDSRNVLLEIVDAFEMSDEEGGSDGGGEMRTPGDASITRIVYTVGDGPATSVRTLKLLPTTILLLLE